MFNKDQIYNVFYKDGLVWIWTESGWSFRFLLLQLRQLVYYLLYEVMLSFNRINSYFFWNESITKSNFEQIISFDPIWLTVLRGGLVKRNNF